MCLSVALDEVACNIERIPLARVVLRVYVNCAAGPEPGERHGDLGRGGDESRRNARMKKKKKKALESLLALSPTLIEKKNNDARRLV